MTLEEVRELCISLPAVTESIKYGTDLCFCVGNKIFLGTRVEGPFRTGIKCEESEYAALIERNGIVPMPRLSTTFWIRIEKSNALSKTEWRYYIKKSYAIIVSGLSKKVKQSLKQSDE